ncbi:MAG: DUF4363 family protein [Clostridia bacterium]|nr:DUF4363 family protein [Clostridia bacterium]
MKRIYIAFVLLGIVAVLALGALWNQQRVTARLTAACDELIDLYDRGDLAACRDASQRFNDDLEEYTRLFPFFLRHERIEDIFYQSSTLPHILDDDDAADFMSTVAAIRMQLEILMDNEWPLPENIL